MTGFRDSALQKLATELRERQVGHGAGDNCGSNQNGMFQAVLKLSSGCLSFRNCRLSRICKLNQLQDAESLVSICPSLISLLAIRRCHENLSKMVSQFAKECLCGNSDANDTRQECTGLGLRATFKRFQGGGSMEFF